MTSAFRLKFSVMFYIQARQVQLKSLYEQMEEMNKNLKGMAKLKHDLHEKSDEFRRDLVSLIVGRSSVRANELSQVIDNVVDATKIMSSIYEEQGNADDHIVQVSADYMIMIGAAQDVLARRRKVQMDLETGKRVLLKCCVTYNLNPCFRVEECQKSQ